MRILKRLAASLLRGAAVSVLVILLSQWILRSLGDIVGWIGSIAGLKEHDIALFSQIFGQLRDAEIASPWLAAIAIGCGINVLAAWMIRRFKVRRFIIDIGAILLGMILGAAGALWFTRVNTVLLGDMIRQLIPILQSGLL